MQKLKGFATNLVFILLSMLSTSLRVNCREFARNPIHLEGNIRNAVGAAYAARFSEVECTVDLPLKDGGDYTWTFADPGLLLAKMVSECSALGAVYSAALAEKPPRQDSPWHLIVTWDGSSANPSIQRFIRYPSSGLSAIQWLRLCQPSLLPAILAIRLALCQLRLRQPSWRRQRRLSAAKAADSQEAAMFASSAPSVAAERACADAVAAGLAPSAHSTTTRRRMFAFPGARHRGRSRRRRSWRWSSHTRGWTRRALSSRRRTARRRKSTSKPAGESAGSTPTSCRRRGALSPETEGDEHGREEDSAEAQARGCERGPLEAADTRFVVNSADIAGGQEATAGQGVGAVSSF